MNRRDFFKTSALAGGSLLLTGAAEGTPRTAPDFPLPAPAGSTGGRLPDLAPAEWIWYPGTRCLANTFILFRREVTLRAQPRSARGWIVADSRYRLEVNGRRIQWGPAPSDPRWAEADPLDLASCLRAGPNALGATVLFYGQGDGTWPIGKPGFLFWLEVEYEDGGRERIVSDPAWRALYCRAWQPGRYKRWFLRALQEEFDARQYPEGWTTAGFEPGEEWLPAMPLGGRPNQPAIMTKYAEYATGIRIGPPESELRPRSVPLLDEILMPVRDLAESFWINWRRPPEEYFECHPPKAFTADRRPAAAPAGPGRWSVALDPDRGAALIFEFSEQIVGWPRFTITAPAGTVVELLVQEGHDVGGAALLDTGRDSWTRFVCREGANHFECFDFESLRWLQLHLRPGRGAVEISDVGVRRRLYPWPNRPFIRTNEPALQRLFDAGFNTLNNSAQDTIVDGMGRERQQYSGDCGHQLHAIRLGFGETRSPARFLTTYSQGQTVDGYFLDCWPAYDRLARIAQRELGLFHLGPILDHGVQFNLDCWHHYAHTGELAALREPYPRLVRFAQYLRGLVNRDGDGLLPVENLGIPCVWIDYQAYHQQGGMSQPFTQRRKQCAFNLYTAAMFREALAPICRAFGDEALAASAEELSRVLQRAAVRRFWSAEHGMFVDNLPWLREEGGVSLSDRALATSILFDQCPGGETRAALQTLADCPKEMGLSYPANAGWRLWALARGGRCDAVVRDLRQRWATMASVRLNNTIQEGWKALPDSSSQWSHCALAPVYIVYQGLAGIRPLTPGYGRVELRPQLADLAELEFVAQIGKGPLEFRARRDRDELDLALKLPPGCTGEIILRDGASVALDRIGGPAPAGHSRYLIPMGGAVELKVPAA